jgi:hypothetical protein
MRLINTSKPSSKGPCPPSEIDDPSERNINLYRIKFVQPLIDQREFQQYTKFLNLCDHHHKFYITRFLKELHKRQ